MLADILGTLEIKKQIKEVINTLIFVGSSFQYPFLHAKRLFSGWTTAIFIS